MYVWAGLGGLGNFFRDLSRSGKTTSRRISRRRWPSPLIGVALPVIVILAGAVGALRAKEAPARLAVLWGAVFVAIQTFAIAGKETRYFLPALPGHLSAGGRRL